MNIGDVWFGFRGDDSGLQVDAKKSGEKAGKAAGKSFEYKLGESIRKGLGMGAGLSIFSAVSQGVGAVKDALVGATQAAMEDESSQAKLRASLEANVKGWDGNTDAIEKVLAARMKLGFSDDEQRSSLALLVAKTGDVTKALEIQRAAMDLARMKGVALAEASKAIAMGMGGSGKALKELGINVKDYASGTEILAAIQAKAAGQAEKYGATTAGAMDEARVALDEASEAIGYKLLPALKEVAVFVRDNAIPAVTAFAEALGFAAGNAGDFATGVGMSDQSIDRMVAKLHGHDVAVDATNAALGRARGTAKMAAIEANDLARGFDKVRTSAWEGAVGASRIGRSAGDAADEFDSLTKSVNDAVDAMISASFEPEQLSLQLKITTQDTKDLQKELRGMTDAKGRPTKGHTWKEVNELKLQISEGEEETRKLQFRLDSLDGTSMTDVTKATKGLSGQLDGAGAHAAFLLDKLSRTSRLTFGRYRGKLLPSEYAVGTASVPFDQLALVHRGEMIVPAVQSAEIRAGQAVLGASAGGFSPNITIYNPEPRPAEADIGRVLRRVAAMGAGA